MARVLYPSTVSGGFDWSVSGGLVVEDTLLTDTRVGGVEFAGIAVDAAEQRFDQPVKVLPLMVRHLIIADLRRRNDEAATKAKQPLGTAQQEQ